MSSTANRNSYDDQEIRLLVPNVGVTFDMGDFCAAQSTSSYRVTWTAIEKGPASVECARDQSLAAPDMIRLALAAEDDGVAAVIVDCMADPGLDAIRESVSIPAFGAAQTALGVAGIVGRRFAIVTIQRRSHARMRDLAAKYGLQQKLACVRSIDIPVLEIDDDLDRLRTRLLEEAMIAVGDYEADTVVLGCTGFEVAAAQLEQDLHDAGFQGVVVVDPLPTTVAFTGAILQSGISHSKAAFPNPPEKAIKGFRPWGHDA